LNRLPLRGTAHPKLRLYDVLVFPPFNTDIFKEYSSRPGVPNPVSGKLHSCRIQCQTCSNTPVCNYQVFLKILGLSKSAFLSIFVSLCSCETSSFLAQYCPNTQVCILAITVKNPGCVLDTYFTEDASVGNLM